MKWTTGLMALVGVMMLAGGCANAKKQQANADVLDISAPAAPSQVAYAPTPAPAPQPVIYDAPVTAAPVATSAGRNYTVQKGDTLWKIASTEYGDGKQWQKIASANPGVSPQTLKVGQVLTIP